MATSGSVSVTVTEWDTLKFSWTLASQSVANNTSSVKWEMSLITTGSGRISSTVDKAWSVTVNGTKYSGTNKIGIGNNETKVLASNTTTIAHDANGAKTFSFSFSQEFSITFSGKKIGTKSGSGSGTLTTIPRASSLTVSNGTLNTEQRLTITRADGSFKHRISYTCGTATGYAAGSSTDFTTGTSISWTPPVELASQNTTGTSVAVTLKLLTYTSGGTQIGTATKTVTMAIPASVKPSCSLKVTDPTGYADKYGAYIKGKSKFSVVVTPTLSYGSAIATYNTSANGAAYSAASFTTGTITSSGTLTISTTVKDKRGRSGTASTTRSALEYNAPAVTKLAVKRCNQDGTTNDQGNYVQVTYSGTVTSLNSKNSAAYVLKYKKTSDSAYTSVTLSAHAGKYSVTNATYMFAADNSFSYNVQLVITDDFSTTTKTTSASTGFTIINFLASGLGIALGKVAELAGYLDIGFKSMFRDKVVVINDQSIYGLKPDGSECNALTPSNANGNTVVGYGNYSAANGQTNVYGHDVHIGVSNISEPGIFRPYRRQGDSLTFTLRTSGYVTDAGKQVSFLVPLAMPIIGSPTVTVTSINGFVLRQDDKYTHGSTASVLVKPDSYSASMGMYYGVTVNAVFSNTTNVINNAPIGIYWNGTITFS